MFINRDSNRFICPSATRVLMAILHLAQQHKPITVRAICREIGYKSGNAVKIPMLTLKRHGLIDWEKTQGRNNTNKKAATIRPLVYLKLTREGKERIGAPGGAP